MSIYDRCVSAIYIKLQNERKGKDWQQSYFARIDLINLLAYLRVVSDE